MQAVSASVGIERQDPPIVQQPHLCTRPVGLSSPVKCDASEIVLGTPPAHDLACYRTFINRTTCVAYRICLGPPSAQEGSASMPVGLC